MKKMKTYKTLLPLFVILGFLATLTTIKSLAIDITVNATSINAIPTVSTPIITPPNPNPGTTFYVAVDINDNNGFSDIIKVNITCVGSGGTEWVDSWDSIKLVNTSMSWTNLNTTAYRVNATFDSSINYWSTKSINGTWSCRAYVEDAQGSSVASPIVQMNVGTSVGISVGEINCAFDQGAPGDQNRQWACPPTVSRNNTITHNGNININVTINATPLTGITDSSWVIGMGNLTWNQTTGAVPTTELPFYPEFIGVPASFITFWSRGTFPITNMTNLTVWLDYPSPLKVQIYQGTITLTSTTA